MVINKTENKTESQKERKQQSKNITMLIRARTKQNDAEQSNKRTKQRKNENKFFFTMLNQPLCGFIIIKIWV